MGEATNTVSSLRDHGVLNRNVIVDHGSPTKVVVVYHAIELRLAIASQAAANDESARLSTTKGWTPVTKTGPNRRTVSTGVFLQSDEFAPPLGTVGRVDFATVPEAERDLRYIFLWYKSCVRSAHAAPDFRAVLSTINALLTNMETTGKEVQGFFDLAGDGLSRIEFRAALSEILRENGLDQSQMDEAIESTTETLGRLDIIYSVLRGGLLDWEASGQVEPVSQRQIRSEYYRRLLRALARHGLDQGTGENSLVVQLVMKLDGRTLVHRTGDEATKEAIEDRRRRRDLASNIKAAVKEGNVG